jgi:hypothetical protein
MRTVQAQLRVAQISEERRSASIVGPRMEDDPRHSRWFKLAFELAETGRYRNVAEVQSALRARDELGVGIIDGICFRARRERGLDT